ncbi:MAG: hypothetical protein M1339_08065 [Bacteroidetes bacterium]|nr:hypothetical protein [Bacteroidota bacterium]
MGSFFGRKIFPEDIQTRLKVISFGIVVGGFPLAAGYPLILNNLMGTGITVRAMLSVLMILPFGFLLGIPFPTAIQLLKQNDMEQFIPWMYGVNAMMSVLGSVTAIILSMQLGFTFAFAIGLFFYMMVFLSAAANTPRRF